MFTKNNIYTSNFYLLADKQVALAFSSLFVKQSINLMLSISKYNNDVSFNCLVSNLSDDDVLLLIRNIKKIRLFSITSLVECNVRNWHISVIYRVYIPWLLVDVDKCLFVESDLLCKGDISPLFDIDDKIAMAQELSGSIIFHLNNVQIKDEVKNTFPYCNAGLCFLNSKRIRNEESISKYNNFFLNNIDKYNFLDQDFYNYYYNAERKILPFQWNLLLYEFLNSYFSRYLIETSVFLHFAGGDPWKKRCKLKIRKLYLKYSVYKPMIKIVKLARIKGIFYFIPHKIICILRLLRHRN